MQRPLTRGPALVAVAFTCLLGAWTLSTRPFAAPDEASHYLRALSIANGSLLGPRVPYRNPASTPAQLRWADHDSRGVVVPAELSPPNVPCLYGNLETGVSCVEATPTGDYPPLPYLLPAVVLSASQDVSSGLWSSRVACALESLGFLLLSVALLSGETAWPLLGLLAAVSPMVLFVCSFITPSGLETAAGLALVAGLIRAARDPLGARQWVWIAIAASGTAVVLSGQLGLLFAALDVAVGAALLGRQQLQMVLERCRRNVFLLAGVLAAASALYVVYGLGSGLLHGGLDFQPISGSVHAGLVQLGPVFRQAVGVFGSLTVAAPRAVYWLWWLLVLMLFVAALLVGRRGQRTLVLAVGLGVLVFPVLFYAWSYRSSGFGLQARQLLPLLVLVPMLAGEVIGRAALPLPPRIGNRLLAAAVALVAALQLAAWWINARNSAGEPSTLWFPADAAWSPPLGWLPWTCLAILGVLALLGFAAGEIRRG